MSSGGPESFKVQCKFNPDRILRIVSSSDGHIQIKVAKMKRLTTGHLAIVNATQGRAGTVFRGRTQPSSFTGRSSGRQEKREREKPKRMDAHVAFWRAKRTQGRDSARHINSQCKQQEGSRAGESRSTVVKLSSRAHSRCEACTEAPERCSCEEKHGQSSELQTGDRCRIDAEQHRAEMGTKGERTVRA